MDQNEETLEAKFIEPTQSRSPLTRRHSYILSGIEEQALPDPKAPSSIAHLFENNRRWAVESTKENPDFFRNLSIQQSPDYLWIGCADSRVPAK